MVESVDTKDLKSFGYCSCAGSSPASSTRDLWWWFAEVAQLVEHNLAKVRVAGSSPVFRSKELYCFLLFWPPSSRLLDWAGVFLYPYLSKKIIAREHQNHQKIYIPLQPELEIVRLFCPRCKGIRWETGAVPAAVTSIPNMSVTAIPLSPKCDGKVIQIGGSQNTC